MTPLITNRAKKSAATTNRRRRKGQDKGSPEGRGGPPLQDCRTKRTIVVTHSPTMKRLCQELRGGECSQKNVVLLISERPEVATTQLLTDAGNIRKDELGNRDGEVNT